MSDEEKNHSEHPEESKEKLLNYDASQEEVVAPDEYVKKDPDSIAKVLEDSRSKAKKIFDDKFSTVAASPNARKAVVVVTSILISTFVYFVFSSTKPPEQKQKEIEEAKKQSVEQKKEELLKTAAPAPASVVAQTPPKIDAAAKLPEPPPITTPAPPEPPPPPTPSVPEAPMFPTYPSSGKQSIPSSSAPTIDLASNTNLGVISSDKNNEDLEKRRKASIIVLGGSAIKSLTQGENTSAPASGTSDKKAPGLDKKKEPYLGFGDGTLETISTRSSNAKSVTATHMGNLDLIIAQGKVVDAVLETAINTEIPGTLRAIVSRDIYGESGKIILIPKGSRLVGSYSALSDQQSSSSSGGSGSSSGAASTSANTGGQSNNKIQPTRIGVIWQRIIRPDGVDFAISEPGVDDLGRAGISGYVDNKFWISFASAFLTSYLIPNTLLRFSSLRNQGTSTTNSTSSAGVTQTNTTGTVGGQQLQDSLNKFSDIATDLVKDTLNTNTVITVDQGETMKVFINQDIIFPPQFVQGSNTVLR